MPRIRIEIVGDASSAVKAFKTTERQAEHLGRELRRADRDVNRFSRGVVAGTGVLGGLGRSIGFASSAFLGGAGLVYAFRKVTSEARNAQTVQVRVAQAVRNSGKAWIENRKHIEAVIQAQSRLSSFDDEELLDTFGKLIVKTKDVNTALKLNALAANVARGRNMDLESSSRLVLKAAMGNAGALRRLGIDIGKNASAYEILTALQKKYHDQAAKFGKTSAGIQERWNKTLEDSEEIIGRTLLPSIDKLLKRGTEWLDQQNRSGQLQKTVNENFKAAEEILTGVADGLKLIKSATAPVVDAVGGVGNAVEVLTVLWVAMKAKAVFGFGATAVASSLTRTKVIADAAAMELALDAATRPRVIPITMVGGGVKGIGAYGTGKLPRQPRGRTPAPTPKGGLGGFLGKIAGYAGPVAAAALATYAAAPTLTVATIVAILASAGGGTHREDRSKKYPRVYRAVARAAKGIALPTEIAALRMMGQYSLENAPDSVLRKVERVLRRASRMGPPAPGTKGSKPPTTTGGDGADGGGGGAPRTLETVGRELARARALGSQGDVKRLLIEERGMMRRQIRSLENRGKLNEKEQAHLDQLYADLASVNSEIASMAKVSATNTKKKNKAAQDAHEKAAQAAKDAAEKITNRWQAAKQQAGQAFSDLFTGPILGGGFGDFLRQYGSQGAKVDPKLILQDIRMQNRASKTLIANLEKLSKRGAPTGMMNALRAMGPEGAAFVRSIANAPEGIFNAIVKAFGERETQMTAASIFIQAKNVTVKPDKGGGGKSPIETRKAGGGMIPGSGMTDSVPAMLTPGEMVLNRMQQGGLARAMGMPGASGSGLFGAIQRMATGGIAYNPMQERLDPPFGMTRHGPRRYSVYGSRGAYAPMRPNIRGWLDDFYGRGLSPAAGKRIGGWWQSNFGKIAQGYKGGGIISGIGRIAGAVGGAIKGGASSLWEWSKGDWARTGGHFKSLYGYLNKQSNEFLMGVIPTPTGIRATADYFKDIGLGYAAPPVFGLQDPKARARAGVATKLMLTQMLAAFRDPKNNLGFLASMLVPIPGPGKVTGPTRALARFKDKILKAGAKFPGPDADVPMQASNMRLVREKVSGRGMPRQFNRAAAESTAAHFFQELIAAGKKPKDVLPPGVRTIEDLVQLQHDLFNSARAGKVAKKWYEKSGAAIFDYAGGDLGKAHKLAKLAAIYSPQVTVEESLRVAARAWEQFHREGKVGPMGIPGDMRSAVIDGKRVKVPSLKQRNDAMRIMRGENFDLGGRKVQNFYTDLVRGFDPQWIRGRKRSGALSNRAMTADVWMMKAFGFAPKLNSKGKWKTPAPNDIQYDFIEAMTKGVADQLGWAPHQAQAAIWTTTKSRFEGRPPGNAAFNFRDYFNRQSTQINYEAAWGTLGTRIRDELGPDAALRYANEKFAVLRPGGQAEVLQRLGLLGQAGGSQRGVYGLDINPGTHDLVLAPRFPEKMQRFRMMPAFEKRVREAAAITGYVLRQDGVGTMTQFPSKTAAGTINANVKAGENAYYLARQLDDAELRAVSTKLGERMIMAPRGGGWILKPFSNRVNMERLGKKLRAKLGGYQLEPATAPSSMVWSDEYMKLIERADKHTPGIKAWALELRRQADMIDTRYRARLPHRAGGGMIPGYAGGVDSVPAMLTPGEMVLNRRQQAGVSQALGLGRRTGSSLFGEIQRFQHGGVLSTGRARSASSFLLGSSSAGAGGSTFQQHNQITVPPEFADTKWAIERGLKSATWRLAKGI